MAITKLNSLAIPANTVVAADLSYPLTSFSSTGIDDNATSTAITIDSSENVSVSPSGGVITLGQHGQITSKQSLDVATAGGRYIGSSNRGIVGQIRIEQTATGADGGYVEIDTCATGSTSPTKRLRVDTDGLKIGNDTAAANALDDYEEGTFTPTITSGVNSISYGNRSGHYTKVGNLVFLDFYIYYSGTGSGAQYIVSGLPYAQKNVNYCRGGGTSTYQNYGGKVVTFYGNQGTSYFFCYKDGSTSFTSSGSVGHYLIGTFTYQTD